MHMLMPPQPTCRSTSSASITRQPDDPISEWLPKYFVEENHPLWPDAPVHIYIQPKLSASQLEARKAWADGLEVPDTLDDEELKRRGLTKLAIGRAVFCRITDNPNDDIFKAANTPVGLITNDITKALEKMTEKIIGSETECGPIKPHICDEYDGPGAPLINGTAFERAKGRTKTGSQGERCYQTAVSKEIGTGITAPNANLGGEVDEALLDRQKFNMVRICYQSASHTHLVSTFASSFLEIFMVALSIWRFPSQFG